MPRIDELYNALNKQGLYTKSLDDFKTQFSTPEAINQLHFALKQEGLYTKPLSDFNNQFFSDQLKKKEEALPSMPSAEGGLLDITLTPQDQPLVSFGEVMPSETEQSPIFQQYQEQKAQRPQGLEYGLPEQKPATPFVQETKKGLFGEELPVQAQPTVPQKPLEVVQSLLPYNFEDLTEAEKITALTQASNSPEVLKSIQTDIESERKKIAEEIEAEKARIAAEEAKNVSDLEKLTRAGIASGKLANKIAYLETLPTAPTSSDFFEIASLMKEIQENTVEDEGGTIGFFKHLPGVVYQSLVSMATAAPTGAAGAAAGGVAGSVAGPGGMIAGLISGFGGGSSLALEYSSSLMSSLQEAGVNVTSARELSDAFNSPEKMSMAREYALKRGIPVAVFDAISGGIAGKFFKPVAGATAKQVMNAALKETGLQSGLGGLGELSAQLIADGEVNMRDVLYEMVAEPVTSIPEIAAGRMSSNTKSLIAKEVATPQQKDALSSIDTKLREVNNAQISTTDETTKSVLGDVATKLEEEKRAVLSEIEKNFDFMTDEEAANVLSASREIKTLQDKAEQVRNNPEMTDDQKKLVLSELKRQAETFDNQRKEIIQNAVQKQATSEVPVQPEARVGEEVAQGAPEAKPEVVTEEGVQEEVTPETYVQELERTKRSDPAQYWTVDAVDLEAAKDGTIVSVDGGYGVVSKEGDIKGVFKTPETTRKGVADDILKKAVEAGGIKLDNFDNYLTPIYKRNGFKIVSRLPFSEEAAPRDWTKSQGTPDVVAMVYDPENKLNIEEKTFDDYDEAMAYRDSYVEQAKQVYQAAAPVDQATVGQTIQNTAQSLQVAFPEVEFIVGDNLEDTRARIVEALTPRVGMEKAQEVANDFKDVRGQALFAGERPVAIVVDKAAANTRTAGHEAWEVMLNDAFGKNPEKFAEFRNSIDRQLRLAGYNDIATELQKFSEQYAKEGNEVVFREYMAEFGGMLVEGGFDIQNLTPQQKSLLQKIKDIINDFAMQLTGKEVFLKDATAENIIDFMSTISQKVAKGETIEEFFETKDTTEIENTDTVFKNRSQKIGDFDIYYFEDEAEFQKLVDDGLVVQNASIDEAAGEPVAVHQPDNLFVGNLSYKGKKIIDGNGGVYYVLKFGNVWASGAKSSASGLVKLINESRAKSSDKKARLVLVRGSQDKMISSVQGVKAAMQILEELVFSGLISTSDFRAALKAAGKKYNIDFAGTSSASSIKADIENKFMNVSDSTFEKRGTFFSDLVDELGKLESPKKNIKEIQKAIGAKKNIRFTKQGIREQLGTIMTERLLLGLPSSHAYAMIEVDEDVTFKEDKEHPSYPYAIVTKSGKPPVLKIFGYRPKAVEAIRRIDGSPASNAQLGLAQRGMGLGRVATEAKITARAQKINYKDLPGYDRMRNEVDGIIEKATKRGATKARIAEDVINYVQNSAVYERANDSQREQMIRDLKKELGQRVKSAPKAERLLGTIKDAKKVTVDEMMALKEKIKAEAKAAKDAVAFINGIRARIAEEIKAMEKSGVLSAKQVQTIINKASKVNLTRPDAVNNFVDYMEKVFKNAEYGEKLSQSNTLQKSIKNLSKSDKVAAGTKAVAKQFAQIEPRRVSNIEEYLEYASALYNAMKPTTGRVTEEGAKVSFKSAVEYDKVQDYANEEIKRQEKQKVDEILARNEDLVMAGVLTEDMNIDEIKKIIDAINSEDPKTLPPAEKEKMIRDYVKKAFGYYRTIALSMIQRGVDPFTGEEIELTESQKKLARRFLEVDIDMMPLKEAYAAVEAIDNFIVNKVTDGMAATIADYVGQVNANNLAKEGYRGKPLRLFYSKNVGRAWAEQIEQLDLMVQRMFGGVNRALAFMRASGANAFKVGKTTTQVQLNNTLNKYAAKFGEVKGFRDLENVMERGVLAFVSRSVNENSTKQQNEFERRKALVEETLAYMKTGTEKEQSQAVELEKVYNNILKGSNSIDQVEAKVKDFNKDAVKFWVDEWSSKYDELQDLSRNVYNVVLGSDINYTPDRFKRVSGKDVAEAQWGESMFANSNDYFDTKEAGVLMENKRIQTLGKRPSRIVSFDFDVNMSNSMYDALMDINTAEATRQMKSFFNSEGFEKIVPTKEDRDLMVDRMKKFVIRSKRKDYVSQDQLSGVFKAMNTIAGLGAGRALGGILQAPKQTIGVAFNTMINSGGRLSVVDAIQANQFINDSGYAIALRGIASNADIQSINKILEKASQTKGDAALRLLNKASEMWLNTFLVKPDVWIARTSWISYYKQQLDKMGYDTSNVDWSSHKLNKEAADYAQAMLDRQQNYSDSDLAGEFFASKEPLKMFLRKTFFPFMTFVMNQKSRMYADLSIIGNKDASTQEKINAGKSLTGMAIELAVYSGMSMFFSSMLSNLTDYLWGEEESEEQKKKRMKGSMQYYAKNIVSDILSPIPVTNEPVRIAFNMALEKIGIDKDTFELPRNFEKAGVFKDLGMNAIAAEKLLAAYDKIQMAATGKFMAKDFFGNDVEKQVDEETREKMMYVAIADFMYALGFAPSEIGTIANKATKKAQKRGKKVREPGATPSGFIQGEIIEAK